MKYRARSKRMMKAEIRFWSYVNIKEVSDCWLWTKYPGRQRYGAFWIGKEQIAAHRYAYRSAFGEFDDKLMVLHKCDTPLCCNPGHLFLGTHIDNMRDAVNKDRFYRHRICKRVWTRTLIRRIRESVPIQSASQTVKVSQESAPEALS